MEQGTEVREGVEMVADGTVTTPKGFLAGAAKVGVRTDWDKLDVGLVYSEAPCVAAGVYTSNALKGASLLVSMEHLAKGSAQVIVANSGCANCSVGERGIEDAIKAGYLTALARVPHRDELAESVAFVRQQMETYPTAADRRERALADFCQVLMCLNEFVYVE